MNVSAVRKTLFAFLFILCMAVPSLIEWLTTPGPVERSIHVTHFRYGTSPTIIRANRGDKMTLTFSTEDTGHSFFLQDYDMDVKVSPSRDDVLIYDPYDVSKPPVSSRSVQFIAGLPGFFGSFVTLSRFRCHVYCGPMHGFEQGDLIVRPNWLFSLSIGLILAISLTWYVRYRWPAPEKPQLPSAINLNERWKWLDKVLKWRPLQFILTLPVLAFFLLLILAGFFGTKVGGRNIAVMVTWAMWMFLIVVVFVPFGGRVWCLICPLPALGEYLQRGATTSVRTKKDNPRRNRFLGLAMKWPKALDGPWLRILLFLSLGSFSASLAGQPRWTAVVLLLFVLVAVVVSLLFERRSFCRYICPLATFLSTYSPVGRLMVRPRDTQVCKQCKEKTCLTGNEQGWGCPYGLLVQKLDNNMNCGMCMECFKSCAYDNINLSWNKGSWYNRFKSYGDAWQVMVMLTLAIAYSVTIHSPWPWLRDIVNMVDKVDWLRFAVFLALLWLFSLAVMPGLLWLLNRWGVRRAGLDISPGAALKKTATAFIPIGLALWCSFFFAMFMPNITYILMTLSDPFGWGWDILGIAGLPWIQLWPGAIPWIQSFLILAGLASSLKKGFRTWNAELADNKKALAVFLPTAVLIITISTGMILYFTYF